MNNVIKSIAMANGNCISQVELFGHFSKSLPGLELIGFGKQSRIIKEKIIFLTRHLKIKIPLNRYVICLESEISGKTNDSIDINYFELPILILFWSMSGVIPIQRLDNVHSLGKISLNKNITIPHPTHLKGWAKISDDLIYLCPDQVDLPANTKSISITELMGRFSSLDFIWQGYEQDQGKVSHIHV